MRKFMLVFVAFVAFFVALRFNCHDVYATNSTREVFAFVETDSGAEGSTFNYFFAAPYVQSFDSDGVCNGKMFSGIIFSTATPPANPTEAESFISQVTKESQNISAIDSAAGSLKEAKFVEENYKFSIYVVLPYVGDMFGTDIEAAEFCEYYINSLSFVIANNSYEHVTLKGMYFDEKLCDNITLREKCISICKEYGLNVLEYNETSHVKVKGVPQENDESVIKDLRKQYEESLQNTDIKTLCVHFDAYNTLHDCALSLSEEPNNPAARNVYEYIRDIANGNVKVESVPQGQDENNREISDIEYAIYAFVASLGAACAVYIIAKCVRKAFVK